MAAPLPAKLKSAGIQPFATRAAQLEKYRPIVSYWVMRLTAHTIQPYCRANGRQCEYYILQQILARDLHTTDSECQTYAIHLMDKLESFKSANSTNDAITDDVAAKAYMENFAGDTFERADRQQREGKVSRQTADTFMAAGTFIEVLGIWGGEGGVEREWREKGKYAKFHAVRIAKAIKAGQDPNETNPVVEEPPAAAQEGEDGIEEELRALERGQGGGGSGSGYQAPSVEEAEDGAAGRPFPVRTMSEASQSMPKAQEDHDVSPIEPADGGQGRQGSVGGGYFPSVPGAPSIATAAEDTEMTDEPPAPQSVAFDAPPTEPPVIPSQPTTQQQHDDPADYYSGTLSSSMPTDAPPHIPTPPQAPSRPHAPPPEHMAAEPPIAPPTIHTPNVPAPFPPPSPAAGPFNGRGNPTTPGYGISQPQSQPPPPAMPSYRVGVSTDSAGGPDVYNTDDESVLAAQKHAKWAISALNFEDVGTAVKELRAGLQALGAR